MNVSVVQGHKNHDPAFGRLSVKDGVKAFQGVERAYGKNGELAGGDLVTFLNTNEATKKLYGSIDTVRETVIINVRNFLKKHEGTMNVKDVTKESIIAKIQEVAAGKTN